MRKPYPCLATAVAASLLFVGCNGQMKQIFRPPSSTISPAPVGIAPVAPASAIPAPANPAAPYVLSAESAGPYINFNIYNLGTTDLVVEKEDFAIIDPDSRNVVPYSKSGTIIDLPQPAIVKPNNTLSGRAIFKSIQTPLGKRLVFKPDEIGTFADINRASIGN